MSQLTHINTDGSARMVDISDKPATFRQATASGRIDMSAPTLEAIRTAAVKKGDVLSVARLAAIMAAKKTSDLIPLCHPLPLTGVDVDLVPDGTGIVVTATVSTTHGTGVEMEALTAVTIGLLTIYDMAKALDRGMRIGEVALLAKSGGRSGNWQAP